MPIEQQQGTSFSFKGEPITFHGVGESLDDLRRKTKKLKKAAKVEKRRQKERARYRRAAIDALLRVANDPKGAHNSVSAARELLSLSEAI